MAGSCILFFKTSGQMGRTNNPVILQLKPLSGDDIVLRAKIIILKPLNQAALADAPRQVNDDKCGTDGGSCRK
jgi:hypothetical protein